MHSDQCEHLRDTYPHTTADGRVKTIPYCRRCGLEGDAMQRKTLAESYPIPKKRWMCGAMAGVWAGLIILFWIDGGEPLRWLTVAFTVLAALYLIGNVYAYVRYDELVRKQDEARARRQAARARQYGLDDKEF